MTRVKAYHDEEFINSKDARALRILAEYLEPKARFAAHGLEDTIVFFGSARAAPGSQHYEAARQLASRARRHVRAERTVPDADLETQREVVDAFLAAAREGDASELCVIGGAEIYTLTLPLATRMYLTHVDVIVEEADAFFPAFDPSQWEACAHESHAADVRHASPFVFVDYVRL